VGGQQGPQLRLQSKEQQSRNTDVPKPEAGMSSLCASRPGTGTASLLAIRKSFRITTHAVVWLGCCVVLQHGQGWAGDHGPRKSLRSCLSQAPPGPCLTSSCLLAFSSEE
jgi:hypothetical protein